MRGLTERQRRVLEFIEFYIDKHGYPPSIRDIARRFKMTPRGAQLHLKALEKKGYISRSDGKARAIRLNRRVEGVLLPIVGEIAAGSAIEMFEMVEDFVEIPKSMVEAGYEHFVLKVSGDSMIGDHIIDGDMVVIRKQDFADNGDIVAVSIDGERATLKRVFFKEETVELRPSNPDMEPLEIERSRVKILGRIVGLVRTYRRG